ncbi:MAG: right-handed parallel beta-helix repeat-containing protein, partial [Oscillospiraceae bacterium]
ANNLVLNCTSYNNADKGYEDADGFAAKFTVGTGNVFDGCISHHNADDGWDLYARVSSGRIEPVTIQNCVAYKNGYLLDGTKAGNGNGFKLGGESLAGGHIIKNSIAFENKLNGITSNSCPDVKVYNCTSYKNEAANLTLYTGIASASTDFEVKGLVSYKGGAADSIKGQGSQSKSKYEGATNYYDGNGVTDAWFKSLKFKGEVARKANGTIDMEGYLELTDKAAKDAGARMTGTASGSVTITPDEKLPNPITGAAAIPVAALAIAGAALFVVSRKRRSR